MPKYVRTGNPEIPQWWLDKAKERRELKSFKDARIAGLATAAMKRVPAWTPSAIAKFFNDRIGRTVDLTNGISDALQIPRPFFVAETESAAVEMQDVCNRHHKR